VTEQKWTVETHAARARELLADAERLKVKYENVRAAGGGPRMSTVGRERQLLTRQLVATAEAYRELRAAPEVALRLAAVPEHEAGSDLDVLEKVAAQWRPKAQPDAQQVNGDRESRPWMRRGRR
jgi:hypothetical protein